MLHHHPWHKTGASGSSYIPILQLDQKKEKRENRSSKGELWMLQTVGKQQGITDMICNWDLKKRTDISPRHIQL